MKDRARHIMEAAESLLLDGGLGTLSAAGIADRAEVNKALIFYYFGSVDALVGAMLERYYQEHQQALEEAFAEEGDGVEDRLHRFVDSYFDWMSEHRAYARVVQEQVSSRGVHEPLVSKHLTKMLRFTEKQLAGMLPKSGPLSAKQFHLSLSAIVINYFTYAPLFWGRDPTSKRSIEERRQHLHFTVEAWLAAL